MRRTTRAITTLLTASAALGLGACYYDDYGYRDDYGYDRYDYRGDYGRGDYGRDDYGRGDYRYGDYRYEGSAYAGDRRDDDSDRWDERDRYYFDGAGADELDPWLMRTREGREIVRMGFDSDDDGRIREDTAYRANDWFRRYADTNRDMLLTDEEIRIALVQAARDRAWRN